MIKNTPRAANLKNRPIAPNKGKEYAAEPLTPQEVAGLLAACSAQSTIGARNRAMITLLYRSGLRVSELIAIRAADVNLTEHSIRLLTTKSGHAQTRRFHAVADDALIRWLELRRARGIRSGPLFCTLAGDPLSPQYVRMLLKRLATKAGIEKRVHPHGLRHTFAAELEATGTPITVISKLLGHESIATTVRYLDHLTNRQAGDALQRADLPRLEEK